MGNQCQWHLWFVLAITCFVSQNYVAGELERVHLKAQPRNGNSSKGDGFLGFLVVGDWGRKGAFNQSRVAFQSNIEDYSLSSLIHVSVKNIVVE
ncbi:purple acid phosphatase 17-like [Gossypium australe]|uniref:Purple acid phosphatase 17-like n=1 Tax=Gossypium australe TaxID=47621 RepID=A0A5B6UUB9_9ROSI|nr:purple acid phosphatase 17-like [Gossypium australe]